MNIPAYRSKTAIPGPERNFAGMNNACFSFIEKPSTPVAIKAFSLTTLLTFPGIIPE